MHLQKLLSMLVFLCAFVAGAQASDTEKEQRWADQIVDALIDGSAEWLEAGGQKFLAIYTEDQTGEPKGGAIILHGIGVHPNWNEVIYPLRTELPNHGWATLSIQMPILPNEAEVKDYIPLIKEAAPRIQAAIAFLKSKNIQPVVIIAHSLGATMASATLAEQGDLGLKGFVAIGMSGSDLDPQLDTTTQLAKLKLPILDLYGSRDLDTVLKAVQPRAAAMRKAGHEHYRQVEVEGADHFFVGLEDELVRRVYGWLEQLSKSEPGEPASKPAAKEQPAADTATQPDAAPPPSNPQATQKATP